MQQLFSTRNISIRDFEEWEGRGELTLAPKFQRREVWNDKARSYLMDTILRGKPIPKLYMRQDVNPETRRVLREIVDGQQRLSTVFSFLKDGFKISRSHHDVYGGKYFSGLPTDVQRDILRYEFVVDLLQDMPDPQVYDLFARINTYSEKLRHQELRNAKYFGDFKSSVYAMALEFVSFMEASGLFTPKQILRMAEAEFISELLLAMHEGVRAGGKPVLDKAYGDYDDEFPNRRQYERRFRETIDTISGIVGSDLPNLNFSAIRLFYPLFCAVYHMKYGLPKLQLTRVAIKATQYPKIKIALERIDNLIERIKSADENHEDVTLSTEDRKFYDAFTVHWVHADKRLTMTSYLCRQFAKALK